MLSWEKPLVKHVAPGSLFYYITSLLFILHLVYYFAIFTFQSINQKYKNIYFTVYLHLSDLTFASDREGIDNPFNALGASDWLFVQVLGDLCIVSYWIDTLVLKTEGNTYATLLHHPFLFKGKPTQAQEVARRISGAIAGEIYVKSSHTKYPS